MTDNTLELGVLDDIVYLSPDVVTFTDNGGGFVGLNHEGTAHSRVLFYRAFPFTHPEEFISIRTIDGDELGMIRRLHDFPADTRRLIERQIQLRYYSPRITKILKAHEEFGYIYWEADTDAGMCRFTSRNGGGAVVKPRPNQAVITDLDGNRFEIPDLSALPPKDYKRIEMFL